MEWLLLLPLYWAFLIIAILALTEPVRQRKG